MATRGNGKLGTWLRLGFELRSIDRIMRSRHADLIVGAVAAAISLVISLKYSGADLNIHDLWHVLPLAVFVAYFAMGGWWTVRTWRLLWRRGRSTWERIVYDHGVRVFGFLTAICLFLVITWLGWIVDSGGISFGRRMMGGVLTAVFFGIPVSLYFGQFCGRTFALFAGVENDRNVEVGEPPPVT
jgi:hypothetical protein